MNKTINLDNNVYAEIEHLEKVTGLKKPDIIKKAIELFAREQFFNTVNKELEELRKDSKAWQEYLAERAEWEAIDKDIK